MEAEKQRLVAQKFEQKARTGDVMIQEKTTFSGLMLAPEVLEGLDGAGFKVPSPIQLQAIPLGRAGLDLIVQAKSGTGKTCVFAVIALESINTENSCMQVVVLAPTREIAVQIWEVIRSIGRAMEKLRCYAFIGGLNINDDKVKLKKCHIAVATPGRFRQLVELDAANVDSVRLFVLDEADKLLEAGFQDDINWIYSALPMNKQMIAASATYPEYLAQQLTTYMRSPKMVRLNACDPALLGISQYYVLLPFSSQPYKVYEEKSAFLLRLLSSIDFQQCLVFSNYQSRAQSLSKLLDSKGWPSTYICGSQEQEKRLTAMAKLRQYQCRVLISTDLTSRGIDVENVSLVVNLDLPTDHETYLHRIGRAGRYGSFGAAVTLVTQGRESADLRIIETRCQTSIRLLPDPIPEDLTHSCTVVDQNIEVTVEEVLQLDPLMPHPGLPVKKHEETEMKKHEEIETPGPKEHEEMENPVRQVKKQEEMETPGRQAKKHEEMETPGQQAKEHEELDTPCPKKYEEMETPDPGQQVKKPEEAEECIPMRVDRISEFDAFDADAFCKSQTGALCDNGMGSLKTDDNEIGSFKTNENGRSSLRTNENRRSSLKTNQDSLFDVPEHDVKIFVTNLSEQPTAPERFATKVQPTGGNQVQQKLDWCSFVKGTLPVSEKVLSLGELVSASRSYVCERDIDAEACDSGPKWVAEDIALPTNESVFDNVGRLLVQLDYDYASRFPCSAKLLGDMLETGGATFPTSDERRVILSAGDAVLRSSVEEPLRNINGVVDRSSGDAFQQNQMSETSVELQTSDRPRNVGVFHVVTPQKAQASKRVKWKREQLVGMEKLSHDIVIAPYVAKLVQELCINRGCEYPRDALDGSRRENARGRHGTKFGGRRSNYSSNWKESFPGSDVGSGGAVEAGRSSYAPSLLLSESVDAGPTASIAFPAEEPPGTILSWPACNELTCITETMGAVCKNQEIHRGSEGKLSHLPCDSMEIPRAALEPLTKCIQVVESVDAISKNQEIPMQGNCVKFSELPSDRSVSPRPAFKLPSDCIQVVGDSTDAICNRQETSQGNNGKFSELPCDSTESLQPSLPPLPECVQVVDSADEICKSQEVPLPKRQWNDIKFSKLPCDGLVSPRAPLEPLQVVGDDESQSLGRDYMLKLSACKDVFESSSDVSEDVAETGSQEDFNGIHWKPSVKQTHMKSNGEKSTRSSARALDQAKQTKRTREHHRQTCRTTKVQNKASKERVHDLPSVHQVHNGHESHDNFMQRGQAGHESHPNGVGARKVPDSHGRGSTDMGHDFSQQSFPGFANLDAYSCYYWNSYMAHLHDAEHFRQLLTSLADQSRLQDIAVQQGAYIQHMIALHRMP